MANEMVEKPVQKPEEALINGLKNAGFKQEAIDGIMLGIRAVLEAEKRPLSQADVDNILRAVGPAVGALKATSLREVLHPPASTEAPKPKVETIQERKVRIVMDAFSKALSAATFEGNPGLSALIRSIALGQEQSGNWKWPGAPQEAYKDFLKAYKSYIKQEGLKPEELPIAIAVKGKSLVFAARELPAEPQEKPGVQRKEPPQVADLRRAVEIAMLKSGVKLDPNTTDAFVKTYADHINALNKTPDVFFFPLGSKARKFIEILGRELSRLKIRNKFDIGMSGEGKVRLAVKVAAVNITAKEMEIEGG